MRTYSLLIVVAAAIVIGCSGGSADDRPLATTVPLGSDEPPATVAGQPSATVPSTTVPPAPVLVNVGVTVPDRGLAEDVGAELSTTTGEPFGNFASCSGARREVGAYSVAISRADGEVRSVSLLSASRVTGSGTVDADMRIELDDGTALVGNGTMTLDAGLRSGSFVAFDADGARIEGSFECLGTEPPEPVGVNDGPPVEVIALLRSGDAERIVSLASSDPALVSCPGAVDGQPIVVRADGGPGLGSLTTFELTVDGTDASLRMRVGDDVAEFGDVELELDAAARAGTFAASNDDLVVDGAFTCE